ncbi:MAG: glycosyltransferase family 39 protein [Planctomycetota bacterium]|jgi:hypothetical protein
MNAEGDLARKGRLGILLLVILAGICLRYTYHARNFVITRDGTEYLSAATRIETEGIASLRDSVRQPLYPLVLWAGGRAASLLWRDFSWRGAEMAQVGRVVGVALYLPFLVAAWFFFRRFAGAAAAVVCLFVVIVHPLFGGYFANVLSETLYLAFVCAALACLAAALRPDVTAAKGWAWAFLFGGFAALSFLTRTEGQLLIAAAVLYVAGRAFTGRTAVEGGRRRCWYTLGGAVSGFLIGAVPAMAYLGATSQRYSLGWLWRRVTASAGGFSAGANCIQAGFFFRVPPAASLKMLLVEAITGAPVLCAVAAFFGAAAVLRLLFSGGKADLAPETKLSLVVLALYAAAITAGVSIQNATVSQRYVQPLVLISLPLVARLCDCATDGAAGRFARLRSTAPCALLVGAIVYSLAVVAAVRRWDRSKVGYRDAGLAIRERVAAGRLLTSSIRLAFYADSPDGIVPAGRLKGEILDGRTGGYAFVAIETGDYNDAERAALDDALGTQGLASESELTFLEDGREDHADRRIIIYRKETAA